MGLTERHWFENEEPELTDRQLEDIVYENKKAYEEIKGRVMSDAESMGMLFDDPPDISVDAFIKWCSDSHMMGDATLK